MSAHVTPFFHTDSCTWTYVIADPATRQAAIVDPVLDFDAKSGRTATTSAQALLDHVRAEGLDVRWLLETPAHADHLSAAAYLKSKLGGRLAIGDHVGAVQAAFKKIFNAVPVP